MEIVLLILIFIVELLKYWILIVTFMDAKIKRRWVAVVGLVIYTLLSVYERIKEDYNLLIMYLIVYTIIVITTKVNRKNKISVILMSILVINCADEVFGIPMKYMCSQYQGSISIENLQLFSSSLLSLSFIALIAILKWKKLIFEKDRYKKFVKKSMPVIMIIMAIFSAFTIGGLNYAKDYVNNDRFTLAANGVIIISFISVGFLAWFMIYISSTNKLMEEMLETERYLKEMQVNYYEEMLKKEENTRKYRHDMNNHFICLDELVRHKKWDSMSDYVKLLQNNMRDIQKKQYYVGNEIIDAILNYHLSALEENVKINVIGRCEKELNLNDVDLCTVFANLIQNAVEELKKESTNEKYIKIIIKLGIDYLKIEILNSISDKSLNKDNIYKTDKKNKVNHGFGLLNVKKTVEKNCGKFETKILNNEFIASVILKQ
ncbi:MAG: sensor histidine kinase [Lachnotalea sp.]